jgi:RNA polymerase sigma factor (sigma-70 family)
MSVVLSGSGGRIMRLGNRTNHREWIISALELHEQPLLRYTYRITKDLDRSRDIVQEAFFKLCRENPASIENHLREWLFTVCRNAALDQYRKARPTVSLDEALMNSIESKTRGGSIETPSKIVEHRLKVSRILSLIEELSEDQREVLSLKFQDDLSYAEISKITGHSVSNVGFLIHIALKKIRDRIREQRENSYGGQD